MARSAPSRSQAAALFRRPGGRQHRATPAPAPAESPSCRCRSSRRAPAATRPARSRPRSNTLVHTVKKVSGIAAAVDQVESARHRQALRRRRRAVLGVAAAGHQRADRSPTAPRARVRAPTSTMVPATSRPGNVRGAGRRRIAAAPLRRVGPVHAGRRHPISTSPGAGRGRGRSTGTSTSGPPNCRDLDGDHRVARGPHATHCVRGSDSTR